MVPVPKLGINQSIQAFCEWLVQTPSSGLSHEAKLSLLDTTACALAGQTHRISQLAQSLGFSSGARYAIAAHAHDFDDNEWVGSTHPSAVLLGALVGLDQQRPLSLGRALDAYTAGMAGIRLMGSQLGYRHYAKGWHATATIGVFGAALAVARALQLNAKQTHWALSHAVSASAGLKAQFGFDAKACQVGGAAEAGLRAAQLAAADVSASRSLWQDFFRLYGGGAAMALTAHWHLDLTPGVVIRKPWPCCQYTHRAIELALAFDGDASQISHGVLSGPEPYLNVVRRDLPNTLNDAKFCLRWCVACALIDRKITLESFTAKQVAREDIHHLAKRLAIKTYAIPEDAADLSPDYPDALSLHGSAGTLWQGTCAAVLGSEGNPLPERALIQKAQACAAYARQSGFDAQAILSANAQTDFSRLYQRAIE